MNWLETLFVACIAVSLIYALLMLLLGDIGGDWLSHLQIPLLQPVTLLSGLAAFGGCGFLLMRLTPFSTWAILVLSAVGGALIALLANFIWVEPMEKAENSIAYSMQHLVGRVGEVWTTIPAEGIGEVVIPMVSGSTNHMASSFTQEEIPVETKVVVMEVRDHVLYVSPYESERGRNQQWERHHI